MRKEKEKRVMERRYRSHVAVTDVEGYEENNGDESHQEGGEPTKMESIDDRPNEYREDESRTTPRPTNETHNKINS